MTETIVIWIIGTIIFLLDLLVVAVKSSFEHANLPGLMNLRETREAAINRTLAVMEKPRLRTGFRLAISFTHIFLAGLVILLVSGNRTIESLWFYLAYLLVVFLVLSLLEFLVESFILQNPEENAIRFRSIAAVIDFLFTPFSIMLMAILGPNANKVTMAAMTEEDLRNWVEVGQAEGSLDKEEREMIYSIFQFGDTLAKDIMVPRIDVLALDITSTLGEAKAAFESAGHSRVPVYEDTVDNVVGLLYAKDLLTIQQDEELIADHRELLRLAYFVPEAKKADELLAEMQARSMHMAIVVDEYGGVAGVVTLEDIVEEIIGEIRDEYDESEEMPFTQVGEDEYIFLGRVDLDIFNEIMHSNINTENADTIGGLIYSEIGDVPTGGEVIEADGVTLIVEQVVGRRITKVRARHAANRSGLKENEHAHE